MKLTRLDYTETPLDEIHDPILEVAGIRLLVKREDMNHPSVSGNKWWKLKYNLEEAIRLGHTTLLTFGGAYSNHIYATAAAAQALGLKSIGIIRGEETLPRNPTLRFAGEMGMELKYVSREAYRHKEEREFMETLRKQFGSFYLLPEGGTNALAIKGCAEFINNCLSAISFDYVCVPIGTGGTLAGIVQGVEGKKKVIGFSALKGGGFLTEAVKSLLMPLLTHDNRWHIETAYHFGGYGKRTEVLEQFISSQWKNHALPLDPVYTSKMLFGIYDLIATRKIERSSTVLMIHTGGLQGGRLLLDRGD